MVECESVPEAGGVAVYVAVNVSVKVPWFTPWDVDRITDAEPFDIPDMKQFECGGPPAQVNDTGLLNPSMGCTEIV